MTLQGRVRKGVLIFGEALLWTIIFGAALLTLLIHFAWYDHGRAVLAGTEGASVDRLIDLTSTLAATMLALVLALLTYRYVVATKDLVETNRTLERIAHDQESRTRPVFKVLNVDGVLGGSDGRAYFHFDVINEGWKDCGIREATVSIGDEKVSLELIRRNRQSPTPLPDGGMHQPLAWVPESDFVVRAGDRRRVSGRASISTNDSLPAQLQVEGVLPTSDYSEVKWRAKRGT